ncbi:MAG: SAM-dependent methyltransferase [Betaproteobacteria bacterium]
MAKPPIGRLYVIPNTLGGVAPGAVLPEATLAVARRLSHFVAETPKLARAFLKSIDTPHPIQSIRIAEMSEHTPNESVAALLKPALDGGDLGLISDAGCPGIADPGALLVAAAHDAGVVVVPLPGPSAILLALMASGMDGQRFVFHGYLPAKTGARAAAIRTLDAATVRDGATQIFIETPYRNDAMLSALLEHAGGRSRLCVAADLTTATELVRSERIEQWRSRAPLDLGGRPAVFLIGRDAQAIPRRRS